MDISMSPVFLFFPRDLAIESGPTLTCTNILQGRGHLIIQDNLRLAIFYSMPPIRCGMIFFVDGYTVAWRSDVYCRMVPESGAPETTPK
jgi:hypothetical protein